MEYIVIIAFIALTIVDAFHDIYVKKTWQSMGGPAPVKYIERFHRLDALSWAIIAFMMCLLLGLTYKLIIMAGILLSIRWIVFDMVHNKLDGKKIFYIGTVSELDKILRSLGAKEHPIIVPLVKSIPLIAFVLLFINYSAIEMWLTKIF